MTLATYQAWSITVTWKIFKPVCSIYIYSLFLFLTQTFVFSTYFFFISIPDSNVCLQNIFILHVYSKFKLYPHLACQCFKKSCACTYTDSQIYLCASICLCVWGRAGGAEEVRLMCTQVYEIMVSGHVQNTFLTSTRSISSFIYMH